MPQKLIRAFIVFFCTSLITGTFFYSPSLYQQGNIQSSFEINEWENDLSCDNLSKYVFHNHALQALNKVIQLSNLFQSASTSRLFYNHSPPD